jgi:hypothetical protein
MTQVWEIQLNSRKGIQTHLVQTGKLEEYIASLSHESREDLRVIRLRETE